MPHAATLGRLADLSEDQWALFTRRQAEAAGIAWSTLARVASEGGMVERFAHGVYRLRGAPPIDHLDLRAAWLQLAPEMPAWERTTESGVVSHRSAASVYGLGHLPDDIHEFTLATRRQSRRPDVRIHRGILNPADVFTMRGLPITRPRRIARDLLSAREDPTSVGHVIADAIRHEHDEPRGFIQAIAPFSARFRSGRNDGLSLLDWLLELAGAPERSEWLKEATTVDDS